ncbi:MGMT family protein [Algoriphagus machipongonensis]|uniref:6-O-methylguanine DNA methyltransferase, DNA binding domain subfamily n=1 Tax=Algoriphagus machipongonensis TaxID=388413 RepID=A3I248_9BACT|nr:MGMT family protein [Algoriphagus machipongonensis]EAZ79452.1 6-O-methylguanine DNA methyltransferase, DNA binding domain subfamily [Algoriphagus machipongonensis]
MPKEKPNYFDLVYQVVREIPTGRATSYGAIAHYLGLKSGARMVGYAMNAAHALPDVPAHRVVNRLGMLTGRHHFSTPTAMQEALESEGVKIENDQIKDFDKVFWDPETELSI